MGIIERGTPRNKVVGFDARMTSGSELALRTQYYDSNDNQYDTDLHIVNLKLNEVKSYYRGFGTWQEHFGKTHYSSEALI